MRSFVLMALACLAMPLGIVPQPAGAVNTYIGSMSVATSAVHGDGSITFQVDVDGFDPVNGASGGLTFFRSASVYVSGGVGTGDYACSNLSDGNCNLNDGGPFSYLGYGDFLLTGAFDCATDYSLLVSLEDVETTFYSEKNDYFYNAYLGSLSAATAAPTAPVQCPARPNPIVQPASIAEGNSGSTDASITVTLDAAPTESTSVAWATTDGTARSASDYSASSGTLTFPIGETSVTVQVPILGDRQIESDEAFNVLADIGGRTSSAQVTIQDDEPRVTLANMRVDEGDVGTAVRSMTLSLSTAMQVATTLSFSTADITATAISGDYLAGSGPVTFAPNQTSASVPVTIAGDIVRESDETLIVNIYNLDGNLLTSGSLTIANDDPVVSVSSPSVDEGGSGTKSLTFVVSLSTPYTAPVTFAFATQGGTATPGSDYVATSGTVTILAGDTTGLAAVTVLGDTVYEPGQTVGIRINYPNGMQAALGTGTITNDDLIPTLSVGSPSAAEGNLGSLSSLQFTVSLSDSSEFPTTFLYSTADGTASGTDYYITSGSSTIPAGSTSVQVAVRVKSDKTFEGPETVSLIISQPANAVIEFDGGTGTILKDDLAPSLKVSGVSVAEGNTGVTTLNFKVSLSAASGLPASFTFAAADGTAKLAAGDYLASSGTASIPAGALFTTVAVTISGDTMYEVAESVKLVVTAPVDARITATSGRVTGSGRILNDDVVPTVTVSDVSIHEGSSGYTSLRFTATLTEVSGLPAAFRFTTASGTAITGTDFVGASAIVSIPAGALEKTFTIKVIGDALVEPDETFTVALTAPSRVSLARTVVTATVLNDD